MTAGWCVQQAALYYGGPLFNLEACKQCQEQTGYDTLLGSKCAACASLETEQEKSCSACVQDETLSANPFQRNWNVCTCDVCPFHTAVGTSASSVGGKGPHSLHSAKLYFVLPER